MTSRDHGKCKELLLKFIQEKTSETPLDLVELIDDMNEINDKYNYERNPQVKEAYLKKFNYFIDKYYSIQEMMDNVSEIVSSDIPDYSKISKVNTLSEDYNPMGRLLVHEMLNKVHMKSQLRNPENEMHKFFYETLGWWFNNYDVIENLRDFSLKYASEEYLECIAEQYGLTRNDGETDDELRERILSHIKEKFTKPTVRASGVTFFTRVNHPHEQLTSHNTYLSNAYQCYAPRSLEEYWENKYICWREIEWL